MTAAELAAFWAALLAALSLALLAGQPPASPACAAAEPHAQPSPPLPAARPPGPPARAREHVDHRVPLDASRQFVLPSAAGQRQASDPSVAAALATLNAAAAPAAAVVATTTAAAGAAAAAAEAAEAILNADDAGAAPPNSPSHGLREPPDQDAIPRETAPPADRGGLCEAAASVWAIAPAEAGSGVIAVLGHWRRGSAIVAAPAAPEASASAALAASAEDADASSASSWAVTLVTQGGPERLGRIEQQATRWGGPVSAAVRVCTLAELAEVAAWHASLAEGVAALLDVHLVVAVADPFPVNALRNLARRGVRLIDGFELVVDADAWLGQDADELSRELRQAVVEHGVRGTDGRGGGVAFCLAAFEPAPAGHRDSALPATFDAVASAFARGEVRPMHDGRRSYSGPFRHREWVRGPARPQPLRYEVMFEPYLAMRVAQKPRVWFPEEFAGRGFNKQAFHFELFARRWDFVVLGRSFVVDQPHASPSWSASSLGVQDNKGRFRAFRARVARAHGLACLDEDWARCDARGVGCHRVCRSGRAAAVAGAGAGAAEADSRRSRAAGRAEARAARDAEREEMHWRLFLEVLAGRTASGARKPAHDLVSGCLARSGVGWEPVVDAVYTWVNGSDPGHAALQRQFIPAAAFGEPPVKGGHADQRDGGVGALVHRFRDFEDASTLRFSLRSLRRFAPWVRRVWIVTADQTPAWLDPEVAREAGVHLVSHRDIFDDPQEQLPTFNSCAIESRLHRIPGLAPCYLYLNDDVLLTRDLAWESLLRPPVEAAQGSSVESEDEGAADAVASLHGAAPVVYFSGERAPRVGRDAWQQKIANVARMVQERAGMRLEFVYGQHHQGYLFAKRGVEEVMEQFRPEFERTAAERWRTPFSVWLPLVYANWIAWHYAVPVERAQAFYFALTTDGGAASVQQAFSRLSERASGAAGPPPQWLCINDLAGAVSADTSAALLAGLVGLLPAPAPFEHRPAPTA